MERFVGSWPYQTLSQRVWSDKNHPLRLYSHIREPLDKAAFLHRQSELLQAAHNRTFALEWIKHDMASVSLTPAQEVNLKKLNHSSTSFILTGQQPGLLGGPLYTFHKALTAIFLAKKAEEKFGVSLVPLFWIADDDSDFKEVSLVEFFDLYHKPSAWRPQDIHHVSNKTLAETPLGSEIKNILSHFPHINDSYRLLLHEALEERVDYGVSFLRILQGILGKMGLLFVRGSSPVYRKAAHTGLKDLINHSREIEKSEKSIIHHLKAYLTTEPIPWIEGQSHVFYLEQGFRHRIVRNKNQIGFYNSNFVFQSLNLASLPEGHLSHDVLSRLVCTETLLPIYATVLGPGEFQYFLQVAPLLKVLGRGVPLVQMRATVSYLPRQLLDDLHRLSFDPVQAIEAGREKIEERASEINWRRFKISEDHLNSLHFQWLKQVELSLPAHYKNFDNSLENLKKSSQNVWKNWISKQKRQAYRDQISEHPKWHARLAWLGAGAFQDRHLNLFSLLNGLTTKNFDDFVHAVNWLEERPQWIWPAK